MLIPHHRSHFWFWYNDFKNTDFDVEVVKRPNIPVAKRRVSYIEIPGRDGTLTETDDTYEDIQFSVPLNFLTKERHNFMETSRKLKNWLTGSGKLKFSDDGSVFYKVKDASIDQQIERVLKRAGFFSAFFTCDPFTYFESGAEFLPYNQVLLNPYYLCKPTYKITGEGVCTFTVNGEQTTINVGQNILIDTDLQIMYKEDGTPQNRAARLIYNKYHLPNGTNSISVSSGFGLTVKPNWRSL